MSQDGPVSSVAEIEFGRNDWVSWMSHGRTSGQKRKTGYVLAVIPAGHNFHSAVKPYIGTRQFNFDKVSDRTGTRRHRSYAVVAAEDGVLYLHWPLTKWLEPWVGDEPPSPMAFRLGDKVRWADGADNTKFGDVVAIVPPGTSLREVCARLVKTDAKFSFDPMNTNKLQHYSYILGIFSDKGTRLFHPPPCRISRVEAGVDYADPSSSSVSVETTLPAPPPVAAPEAPIVAEPQLAPAIEPVAQERPVEVTINPIPINPAPAIETHPLRVVLGEGIPWAVGPLNCGYGVGVAQHPQGVGQIMLDVPPWMYEDRNVPVYRIVLERVD